MNPDHIFWGSELVYTILIILFCLLIYFKTKEAYSLTKHKGIKYFRLSFLFFSIAYASRLILFVLIFGTDAIFGAQSIRGIMPVSNSIVGFFSTIAILYLTYSTIWQKIDTEKFLSFTFITAFIISVFANLYRSPGVLSIIQLLLIATSIVIIFVNHKNNKKLSTVILYLLIFLFWFINILILQSRNMIPIELKIIFQILSIIVFILIFLKIKKWIK